MGAGYESTIDIYLRVRPIASGATALLELNQEEGHVTWTVPRHVSLGMVNHQREHYTFKFSGIFDVGSKQDEVFQKVAHKVVVGSLEGYNGTVFAYGQTGSGKTYTITGGAERYVDRGIIPRAISLIFSEIAERSDYTYTLHFSYMEVYNEMGYDLLNPDHETKALEDLPKVTLLEDEDSVFHLRNLSQHLATYVGAHSKPSVSEQRLRVWLLLKEFRERLSECMQTSVQNCQNWSFEMQNCVRGWNSNEEEALNLLFIGDTNRIISSTPMNMASSRSHCIFTAHILACKVGEETVRKSKLNLVDLAGSERVWKTGVDGQILREAKYINLSLHYLEQVIVALQEKSQGKMRTHIPYRNSMMTSVLRDSIGGNCRTVMIATVTCAQEQLPETISTCRFAQRVAMIANQVTLNEEVDPNLLIKRLKQQIRDLKEEIAMLRGENENRPPLSASEIENVRSRVAGFVSDKSADADLLCGGSTMHVRAAFQIFKEMLNNGELQTKQGVEGLVKGDNEALLCGEPADVKTLQDKVSDLQYQLKQRDNEIQILVAFIRKREAAARGIARPSSAQPATDRPNSSAPILSAQPSTGRPSSARPPSTRSNSVSEEHGRETISPQQLAEKNYVSPRISNTPELQKPRSARLDVVELTADTTLEHDVMDKDKAFELFLRGNAKMEVIEENKTLLKTKYADAKALGEKVNRARDCINVLKERIEKHRVERARDYLVSGVSDGSLFEHDQEEDDLLCSIDAEKRGYKEGFGQLRDTKKEIEHLHKLLEQNRGQLQADFEVHWSAMTAPPLQMESLVKAPSIPRLKLTAPIVPQHQSKGGGRKSPFSYESNSLSTLKNLRSPLSGFEHGMDLHGKHSLQVLATTSPKDYSFPSTSGAGVDKSLDHLLQSTKKQSLRDTNNITGLKPIPLTGNADADADIIAFYKARARVLKKVS